MGGSSSSRHTSEGFEDTEGVVFVKGIRLTDRVVDRMREPISAQHPQSKSSTCPPVGQSLTPQSEASTELLAPRLPHPPSYASALVPPLQEPLSPVVPLASVSQETPEPPASTPTVEAVPSVTRSSPDSLLAPMPSVQEHVVISTSTDFVPSAPSAEPLPITKSSLTVTESVVTPLPAEPVPVVLSPPAEAVDISPSPSSISDPVMSPPPSELLAIPAEAPTMALTDDVLTAPPVEANPSPTTVEPIDIPILVESTAPSTPALTLDRTLPVEQVALPTTPTSEPVSVTEMPLSPGTPPPAPIESVEVSADMPHAPVEPSDLSSDLEELLPPPPSSALAVLCEVSSVGQIGCPSSEDTPAPTPVVEPHVAPRLPLITESVGLLTSPQAVVNEEELRKQIREELQKLLQEQMKMAKQKIQQQLKEEKAKAEAEAQTKAQEQIQAEVQKVLEKEQLAFQQTLIMKECKNIQDEQLASQYYWMERKSGFLKQIQKLEEKERELAKQDSMYKEQIGKLEEKTAQLTRVTAESFKKGLEETHKRFKRFQIKPVCSELQSEILRCFLQNTGQTLTCSSIASQYVKCVNNAKQNKKVSTGG